MAVVAYRGVNGHHLEDVRSVSVPFHRKIGLFDFSMVITYDFGRGTSMIHSLHVQHEYFVTKCIDYTSDVEIRNRCRIEICLVDRVGYFRNIWGDNSERNLYFFLDAQAVVHPETRMYSLNVHFVDAPIPSGLDIITIPNIMDEFTVLKWTVTDTVSAVHDLCIHDDILSVIFHQFLSKFQWTYPKHQIIENALDCEMARCLAELGDESKKGNDSDSHWFSGLPIALRIRYVLEEHLDVVKKDYILWGIAVRVQIHDSSINEANHPKLMEFINALGTPRIDGLIIWTKYDLTPQHFHDLCALYDHIGELCEEEQQQIEVNAECILCNVPEEDVAMILAEWAPPKKRTANPSSFARYFIARRHVPIINFNIQFGDNRNDQRMQHLHGGGRNGQRKQRKRRHQFRLSTKQSNKLMKQRLKRSNRRRGYHRW